MNRVLFKSSNDSWSTPMSVYFDLNKEFNFNFDPCPLNSNFNSENITLFKSSKPEIFDGLQVDWGSSTFVNPPYSQISDWCKKAYEEYQKGKLVVMLIPSRTDTAYWHEYIMQATEIRFIRGRLKFGDSKNSAPFPSAVIVFNPLKASLLGGVNKNQAA